MQNRHNSSNRQKIITKVHVYTTKSMASPCAVQWRLGCCNVYICQQMPDSTTFLSVCSENVFNHNVSHFNIIAFLKGADIALNNPINKDIHLECIDNHSHRSSDTNTLSLWWNNNQKKNIVSLERHNIFWLYQSWTQKLKALAKGCQNTCSNIFISPIMRMNL